MELNNLAAFGNSTLKCEFPGGIAQVVGRSCAATYSCEANSSRTV
jgi:hypothetical protein